MEKKNSSFDKLYAINVNDKTSKKGPRNLTYLAWASAWAIIKQIYPDATYIEYESVDNETNLVLNYFHDNKTCWVKCGTKLTKDGPEYIKTLPIMDYNYKSITFDKVTSRDVNDAMQRCLVKSLAMHGLGLYLYEKDELPNIDVKPKVDKPSNGVAKKTPTKATKKALPTLKVGDDTWAKFVIYAKTQKSKKTLEEIIAVAETKYKVGAVVKKELTKILK